MTDTTEITNPFSGNEPAAPATSSVAIGSQRAIAEVQAAILLAKQFPRDKQRAVDDIINECGRISLAETAMYTYARGGTNINGPTIRLAEAIALAWGNIQFGWNEMSRNGNTSEIEAWAWDTEKNIRSSTKFIVKHFRNTKKGGYALTDERDIYELCANNASRRLRGCLLRLIPGDVIDVAIKQCNVTLQQNFAVTPEKITELVNAFKTFNVTKEHLEKRMQRRMDSVTSAQIVTLHNIYNSIKDGMSEASEWFDMPTNAKPALSSAEAFTANRPDKKKTKSQEKPIADDTPAVNTPECDPATGEVAPDGGTEKPQGTLLPASETGEDIIVKAPPGSTPPTVACLSVKDAAKKILKAIEARYQKGKHEEITWIVANNTEILVRIQHEEPDTFKVITDLSGEPTG